MDRTIAYKNLVDKRKADRFSSKYGFKNQADYIDFDTDDIGNYSNWANDLNADLMVIAQDYCDMATFVKCKGKVQLKPIDNPNNVKEWETKTNYYLWKLLKSIGRDIGLPNSPKKAGVFLTNAVLDLKPINMSAKVNPQVSIYSGQTYLKPLIEIIQPHKIITLGKDAAKSLLNLYSSPENDYAQRARKNMSEIFRQGRFAIRGGQTTVFPFYHPGSLGQSGRLRIETDKRLSALELMMADWKSVL